MVLAEVAVKGGLTIEQALTNAATRLLSFNFVKSMSLIRALTAKLAVSEVCCAFKHTNRHETTLGVAEVV